MSEQPQESAEVEEVPESGEHVDNDELSEDEVWQAVQGDEVEVSDEDAEGDQSRSE